MKTRSGLMVSYLCTTHLGGAEEHAHRVVRGLRDLGEDVTLLVSRCPHSVSFASRCVGDEEIARFDTTCGYPIQRIDRLVPWGSGLWKAFEDRLVLTRRIYRLIKKQDAKYIIVNWVPTAWSLSCVIAARWARVPVIQLVHTEEDAGSDNKGRLRRVHSFLARFLLKRSERVVCVSREIQSVVHRVTEGRARATVIYNGVDLPEIEAWKQGRKSGREEAIGDLRERGLPEDIESRPTLFTLSRLVGRKGVQHTLAVMPSILEKHPDACLLIGGDGGHRAELEALADRLLTPDQRRAVVFLGWLNDEQKYLCYELADLFVMPSWGEGFPLVYQEAAAFGKPSIGLDVEGNAESILHNETGVLIPANDGRALENAVANLLSDPDRRLQLGEAAYRRVENELNWDTISRAFQQVIAEETAR